MKQRTEEGLRKWASARCSIKNRPPCSRSTATAKLVGVRYLATLPLSRNVNEQQIHDDGTSWTCILGAFAAAGHPGIAVPPPAPGCGPFRPSARRSYCHGSPGTENTRCFGLARRKSGSSAGRLCSCRVTLAHPESVVNSADREVPFHHPPESDVLIWL